MSDKERILSYLVAQLLSTCAGSMRNPLIQEDTGNSLMDLGLRIKPYGEKPKKGDLVCCKTSWRFEPHPYMVAWVEEVRGSDSYEVMLRELGTNKLCKMSNEDYYIFDFKHLSSFYLLEGEKYNLYQKIRKTFGRYGDGEHKFDDVKFDDETEEVTISVRQKWNSPDRPFKVENSIEYYTQNYDITLKTPKWGKRLSMKKIAELMEEQGWCTREFPVTMKSLEKTA